MTTDHRLEGYLAKLEKVLGPFSASDRAEIVMEIKSHVLAALDRDPSTSIDSVLAALGEPETVANRYLLERGMKPTKPPMSPVVKWLVLGFLGTIATGAMVIMFILYRFNPIIQIDEKNDHVSILGGLIDINGKEGSVRMGPSFTWKSYSFDEKHAISKGESFRVKFKSGKVELRNSDEAEVSWYCRMSVDKPPAITNAGGIFVDLKDAEDVKCEIEVPEGTQFYLDGENGKIDIEEPHFHSYVRVGNGKVNISPDQEKKYAFDLSVQRGETDRFESSTDPTAYRIQVRLNNGKIDRSN